MSRRTAGVGCSAAESGEDSGGTGSLELSSSWNKLMFNSRSVDRDTISTISTPRNGVGTGGRGSLLAVRCVLPLAGFTPDELACPVVDGGTELP